MPELEKRGHRALTVDLPIADPTAGVDEYVAAVADVLAGAGDDPILVAHSLSGLIAPVVADRHRVARIIYLGAILPAPGESLLTRLEAEGVLASDYFGALEVGDDGTAGFPPDLAGEVFYADCTPEDRDWAVARLGRQAARDRLGVEPRELPGGHSPFITRPVELADLLVGLSGV